MSNNVVPPIAPTKVMIEDFPSQRTGIVQAKLSRVDVAKGPAKAAVSRAVPPHLRQQATASDEDVNAILEGGTEEMNAPESPQAEPVGDEGVEAILSRFKGSPEEIARQLAKSYAASEKTMRQLQNEKALLLSSGGKPLPPQNPGMQAAQPAGTPVAQPASMVPVTQQVNVNPFDYKKAGSNFLDDIEGTLKSFDEHQNGRMAQSINQVVQNLMVPMYDEMLQMKFSRQFPEVVNEESWPIIKVLASQSDGASDRDKLMAGVKKYQKQMVLPSASAGVSGDMADMRASVQQPSATASGSSTDKKVYKISAIRKIMGRQDYGNDQDVVRRIEAAIAEGRVDRNG